MARRKKDRFGYVFAGIALLIFAAGVVLAAPHHEAPPFERMLDSTVKLDADGRLCSGVTVLRDGLILTNAHCAAADAKTIEVTLRDGRKFIGLILVRDEAADVMVVAVRARALVTTPLHCNVLVAQGDDVIAIGHPGGMLWSLTRGVIVALDRGDDKRWHQIDAMVWFGNSGGPLFDRLGRLIGLNNAVQGSALPWGGGQITYGYSLNLRHICAALRRGGVEVR